MWFLPVTGASELLSEIGCADSAGHPAPTPPYWPRRAAYPQAFKRKIEKEAKQ